MEKYIIILVILATIYFIQNNLKITEGFEATATQSVYGVDDLNAINTLAQISRQLMSPGGLTVPGNMTVSGNVTINGHNSYFNNAGANFININRGTTIDKNTVHLWAGDGTVSFVGRNDANSDYNWPQQIIMNAKTGSIACLGNGSINAASMFVDTPNEVGGSISIRNSSKKNAGQTNNWTIWNMTAQYGNKLAFWRYNADGVNAGPALELFDNGTIIAGGNLNIGTGANINGGRTYITDEENKGRLRVGAAWGIPGIYSQDAGNDIVIGAATEKVQIGNPGGNHKLCVNGRGMRMFTQSVGDNAAIPVKDPGGNEYPTNIWVCSVQGVRMDWGGNGPGAINQFCYQKDGKWFLRSDAEGPGDGSMPTILAIPLGFFESSWQVQNGPGHIGGW